MDGMSVTQKQLTDLLTGNTHESSRAVREFLFQHINNPECAKSVVAVANRLLANSKTRSKGLLFVQILITQYTSDVFTDNILLQWSSHCMIQYNDSTKELKLKTLTLLIKHGNSVEFNKKFSAEYLNSTLKACLIYRNNEERVVGLKCLTQCMKRYPSWFGNQKDKVEEYLINCLESPYGVVVEAAAVAFTCLLETGAAGVGGINYINNFRCCLKKLCITIQTLYNIFFRTFSTLADLVNSYEDMFPLVPSIEGFDSQAVEDVTTTRIINCLILMKTLLIQSFSVEKQVLLQYVTNVIHRGLSSYLCLSKTDVLDSKNNSPMLLKKIQLRLFDVFRVLVKGYHSSLMPYSVVFENTLLKNFQRVAKCNCFVHDMKYKTSAYKTQVYWLSFNKVINEVQFQEKILPIILEDIDSSQKAVLLKVNLPDGNKVKKFKTNDSSGIILKDDIFVEHRCIYALGALKHLLSASLTIDDPQLKEIICLITRKLFDIQSQKLCVPYNHTSCQVKLFEVFISFMKRENISVLPSMHLMTNILKLGMNSRNSRISHTSMHGLNLLEKISHSTCPTLNLSDSLVVQRVHVLEQRNTTKIDHESEKKINIISDIVLTSQEDEKVIAETQDNCETICQLEDEQMTDISLCEEREQNSTSANDNVNVILDNDLENMFHSFEDVIQK